MRVLEPAASFRIGAVVALSLLAALLPTLGQRSSAQEWSPPRTVYVESAGHTVDGLFLAFWRDHQAHLGDPITEEFTQAKLAPELPDTEASDGRGQSDRSADEGGLIVQYFENGAIAYVPENDPGDQVAMVPIGRAAADSLWTDDARAFRPVDGCGSADDPCVFVEETEHTVRHGFATYWQDDDARIVLGDPISEEFVGEKKVTYQVFEFGTLSWTKADDVRVHAAGEDIADLLDLDTGRIARPDGLPMYDEALFVAPEPVIIEPEPDVVGPAVGADSGTGPGPLQGSWKEIVISLSQQTLWAYENGTLFVSTLVSTGTAESPAVETPLGFYQVLTKYDVQTMEGTISDEYYRVEDVPDVMYFDNLGNAIHGAYWHSNFGTPMSHGCVNAPLDIAAMLYDWAPIGTAVSVIS